MWAVTLSETKYLNTANETLRSAQSDNEVNEG